MKRLAGSYLIVFLAGFGCVRTPSGRAGKPSASAQVAEHSASRLRLYCRPTTKSRERTKSAVAERAVLAGSASDTVHGRVVVPNGNDAQELAVSIGEQRTLTDVDGRFVFHNIPATYDLKVADEDGRRVTAYYGLTRRDPVVAHTAHDASKYGSECYHASVAGRLQVDPGIPGSSIAPPKVYFFSPTGFAEVDSTQVPRQGLATYGPVPVDWTGDSVTSGTLLALSIGQANAYLATVPVALADGDARQQDLHLAPVPMERLAGSALVWGSKWSPPEYVKVSYTAPGSVEGIDLGKCGYSTPGSSTPGAFDCRVPDLSVLGGEYCVSIVSNAGHARANRCGGKIGMKDFSIPPSPPQPTLTSADAVHATGDMVWWTGREQSLCQLNIGTCSGGSCAVAYFVGSSFSWFDFQALDMRYHPGLRKAVTVSALYPYTTVDELAASSEPLGKRATWQRVDLIEDEIKMPNISREATAPRRPRGFGYEDVAKLPTCSSTSEAQSLRNIGAAVETRVSVRGILTLMGWACTLVGCAGGGHCCNDCWAEWVLENAAPKIRVLGLLQNMEPLGQVGANECHLPAKLPRVEVIASGVLVSNGHDRYSLDEFNLCAVRPGAPINGH